MTDRQNLIDLALNAKMEMDKLGYNPLEALIEMSRSAEISDKTRVDIHKSLLKHFSPAFGTVSTDNTSDKSSGDIIIEMTKFDSKKISGGKELKKLTAQYKSLESGLGENGQ